MKILVDVGNTRTKYIFENDGALNKKQIINNEQLVSSWFDVNLVKANEIIIASVSQPGITQNFQKWANKNNINIRIVESERERFGITNCYDNPEQLGVDRWLALIGGSTRYPNKSLLIIDAGTATTIDLLSKNGQHQGGWIFPGIDSLFSRVLKSTTKVNAQKKHIPEILFGKNTSACVNNGCWAATVGLVKQAIIQAEHIEPIDHIILLGGNANSLANILSEPVIILDNLIMEALQQYIT